MNFNECRPRPNLLSKMSESEFKLVFNMDYMATQRQSNYLVSELIRGVYVRTN